MFAAVELSASAVGAEPRECSAAGRALTARAAWKSAEDPSVLDGPNFVVAIDAEGAGELTCVAPGLGRAALFAIVEHVRRARGVDAQLALVLTLDPLSCGDLTYFAIANDVRGIGYAHDDPREVFDDSPSSRLEGIAFLNDLPYWERNELEFAAAFQHEVGHRWAARVHADVEGAPREVLLGRQQQHWSYFLDTEGSFLEGNRMVALGDGGFRVATPLGDGRYSSFDLYLMGVLPAEEVSALALLAPEASAATDCRGRPLTASSPPQWCAPLLLRGSARRVDVDAVIRAEGPRVPPASAVARTLDVAVIVLAARVEAIDARRCAGLASAIEARLLEFERATYGRLRLSNLTVTSATCGEFGEPAVEQPSGGCRLGERAGSAIGAVGLLLLGALRRRARRRER